MSSDATSWALKVKGVSPRAKLVLIAIADSANAKSGISYPSRKTLAEAADCSLDTVDRCIKELVKADLLHVEAHFDERVDAPRRQTSNRYHLHLTPAAESRPPSRETAAPQPHPDAAPPAAYGAAPKVNQENEHIAAAAGSARAPDWRGVIFRLQAALGPAFDPAAIGTQHVGDLRTILAPEVGVPCTEADLLEAAAMVGAQLSARRDTLRSWSLLVKPAVRNRDRRLAGLPDPQEPVHAQHQPARLNPRRPRSGADVAIDLAREFAAAERAKGVG